MKLTAAMVCDLCHRKPPSLYCSSDSAFLCSDCDSQVHTANFLVARHIRFPICSLCKSYHSNRRSCDDDNDDASSSSSSTVCLSSSNKSNCNSYNKTTTSAGIVVSSSSSDWKTRDVLVDWCTRLGGGSGVIEVARHAFQVWWHQDPDRRWVWPYRVGLAASLWLGLLRFTKDDENKRMRMRTLLMKLEKISGVPAKSIVVAQSKLAGTLRTMKHRRQGQQHHDDAVEESWAEC